MKFLRLDLFLWQGLGCLPLDDDAIRLKMIERSGCSDLIVDRGLQTHRHYVQEITTLQARIVERPHGQMPALDRRVF
jgi:hypothetical protein